MAYMLYERVSMEIVTAFRDRPDIETELAAAARFRAWVLDLPLSPAIQAAVLEPVAAVEEGLREALRRRARDQRSAGGSGAA